MTPVALTIAGSDPSGGAGLQADLKTFSRFEVYGAAVVTLLTVQNTKGVSRVEVMAPDLVAAQIEAVLSDLSVGAVKTGALGSVAVIEAVATSLAETAAPVVVDPVMISKHGAPLLSAAGQDALRRLLLPQAALLMPNIPEAEALTGMQITEMQITEMKSNGDEAMVAASHALREMGAEAVLLKGGHRVGEPRDLLSWQGGDEWFEGKRVNTRHTHGTGCTLSAAITAGLARGETLRDAVARAKKYVQRAIETAPGLGAGYGPLNHFAQI